MWPGITYETRAWQRDPDELALIPKSRRRKILPTYEAAVPANIAALPVEISAALARRLAEVEVLLARFDQEQVARGYALPALLLRSESSSGCASPQMLTRCLPDGRRRTQIGRVPRRTGFPHCSSSSQWSTSLTLHRISALPIVQPAA